VLPGRRPRGSRRLGLRKHACGINHAITDDATAGKRVFARMLKERPGLNIGVEAGRSGLVLADADDQAAVDAWHIRWLDSQGGAPAPTVLTPGRQLPDGTWAHKDGAHFWYRLTEDQLADLPTSGPGSMQLPGGVSLSWRDRQALVPPSVRDEGPYRLVGKVEDCPEWLFDMIVDHIIETVERKTTQQEKLAAGGPDDIEGWSARTPWHDLLTAAGWTSTLAYDSCGPVCSIWTRPGEAGSAKSATAHEPGCTETGTETGWGPLHVWSDIAAAELGSRHLSKLQFYAATQHDHDVRAAMAALGLASNVVRAEEAELTRELEEWWADPRRSEQQSARESETEPSPATPASGGSGSEFFRGGRYDLAAYFAGTEPETPKPSILHRSDGESLLYRGTINQLIGEAEGGKTWVALAALAEVLVTGGKGAYVDIDGNGVPSLVSRLAQLGADVREAVDEDRFAIFTPTDPEQFTDMVTIVTRSRVDLVVVDSFGEAMPIYALSTNDNDEVTAFMRERLVPMADSGAAVLVIDHVVKNAEARGGHGIGAQAKKRRTDGAYVEVVISDVFSFRLGGRARLFIRKDRHAGLNNATSRDRYWGSFVLEAEGRGYRIESAAPASPSDSVNEVSETIQRHMVSVSRYLHGLLGLAVEAGDLDPAAASARSARQLREANLGVRAADMTATLNRLLEAGAVGRTLVSGHEKWHSVSLWTDLEDEVPVPGSGPVP
jgi:hypothetical protein